MVGINDLAYAHPCLHSAFTPPALLVFVGLGWLLARLEGTICFHYQGKELKAAVTRYLVTVPGQDFRHIPVSLLSVCPSHVLVVDIHILVQE